VAKQAARKKAKVAPQKPTKYTASAMVSYLAAVNELPKAKMREVFESVFDLVESGVMAGVRVPIGKMGKVYVRVRPAQKARKGRNPLTGEEITIKARPATKVPKFTFNRAFKMVATKAKVVAR
jgi:nucleoid DNA-binding protein